jgi:putative ABC transport system substrate-binding protein
MAVTPLQLCALVVGLTSAATASSQHILHACDCPPTMAAEERDMLLLNFGKLGYLQGGGLDLQTLDGASGADSWEALLRRQVENKPALILASGVRVAQAAKVVTTDIPVVFWRVTDPVGSGLASSLSKPGANVTGFSRGIEKLTPKRLEVLRELLPSAKTIGFVYISDDEPHRRQATAVKDAAPSLGLRVIDYALPRTDWSEASLDRLFQRMRRDGVDGFLLPDINIYPQTLVELSDKYRLPTVYSLTHMVTGWGGLAAYSTEASSFTDVVGYADRILRGAKPADLPIHEPTRFELILNTRAARDMQVALPKMLLLRATEIVEK